MASSIPSFYRVWFTIFDPILSVSGLLTHVFTPLRILDSYSPYYVNPPATETVLLQDSLAGFFAGITFLEIVLLRLRPNDIPVWKALQANTLMVDLFMLWGFAKALARDGRTDLRVWKSDEWINIGILGGVALIRTAFLVGVGMQTRTKGKKS